MLVRKEKIRKLLVGNIQEYINPNIGWSICNDLDDDPFMESVLEKLNGRFRWRSKDKMLGYKSCTPNDVNKFSYLNNNREYGVTYSETHDGHPSKYFNVEFEINASQFLKLW